MAFASKLLGAATLVLALGSSAHAETLASMNAFACGVDGPSEFSGANRTSTSQSGFSEAAYAASGLDPEMPATVKLRIIYEKAGSIETDHCGGTVVNERWIVTAAHCVAADTTWDRIEILAGDTHLDSNSIVRRVSRDAICHSGFQYENLKDDVALIRLEEPLPPHIVPAPVDDQGTSSAKAGGSVIAAGWPVTGRNAGDRHLNKTTLNVTNVEVPGYITVSSATGSTEGVCRGESGGPLMAYGPLGLQLAGVLSGIQPGTEDATGEECMLAGYEMYFTPIAAFTDWMDNVLALCDDGPDACLGTGSTSMLLASASPGYQDVTPSYQGDVNYAAYEVVESEPITVEYDGQSSWGAIVYEEQPAYETIVYQEQPVYEVSYVETTPIYVETTPIYTTPAIFYEDVSETYIDVTHTLDVTHNYEHIGAYDQGYSVAYVNSFIYE